MQFENGALKITNNICSLCNIEFENFVDHLVLNNHINHQFLTKEFCSSLALNSNLISSHSLPMSLSSLQTLIFYLKSQKLPLYFKQLYSCHKCLLIFDSIHLLFSHLNNCDSNTPVLSRTLVHNENSLDDSIPVINLSNDSDASNPTNDISAEHDEKSSLEAHDSDVEIVAEFAVQKSQPHGHDFQQTTFNQIQADFPNSENIESREQLIIKAPNHPQVKRIEITNNEALILKSSSSFSRPISPSKDTTRGPNANHNKNVFSPKSTLESRSNKRLLRNLNKKPEPKRIEVKKKAKKEECADIVVFNSSTKKKFNKICGSIFKTLKCKFCNRGNFKHEQNLRAHYQNVHSFFPLQPQSESILSRFTSDEMKKYFQFRCLSCLKMFENFTTLSQHRCKYYLKQIHIPKKHSYKQNGKINMMKPFSSAAKPETLPDYDSENEFFKNIGLVRKINSPFKCEHTKLKLQSMSAASKERTRFNCNSIQVQVQVAPSKCIKSHTNGYASTNRLRRSQVAKVVKPNISDDVIISLVSPPNSSKRKHNFKP